MGVLNDYKSSGIHQLHHLWGVPILREKAASALCIALDWKHTPGEYARQRPGLPSLSWTGWAGQTFLPRDLTASLCMVYIDQERKTPLEEVYQTLSNSNAPPRLLHLNSTVTEVAFIPGDSVVPMKGRYPPGLHPDVFAILPITDTEQMVCATFIDHTVEMMTPYPAILLEHCERERDPFFAGGEFIIDSQATLLVVRETDGHFERVGLVKVGQVIPFTNLGSMTCGFRSTDHLNGTVELSRLEPTCVMQQKWRQNAEEKTICLG